MTTENVIVAIPLLLVAAGFAVAAFHRIRFLIRGWTIRGQGRDRIQYVERGNCSIVLDAELMCGPLHRVISVPTAANWDSKVPDWARGRREEILARLKLTFPRPKYWFKET